MPLSRATCPECGATLKTNNPAGFTLGQALECPKCQTYFAVEEPKAAVVKPKVAVVEDDEDDDRPQKKRRRDDDDRPRKKKKAEEGGGYRTSALRFVVLGVLVFILIIGAVLLKLKWDKEKQEQSRKFDPMIALSV